MSKILIVAKIENCKKRNLAIINIPKLVVNQELV